MKGFIITDDLVMKAIAKLYTPEQAAIMAVLAGNDLICSTDFEIQYNAIMEAVNTGIIPTERLDTAVYRILGGKAELGLPIF